MLLAAGCAAESGPSATAQGRKEPALELTGRVIDAASILSEDFEGQLTAKLAQLEEETKVQLVVATTPDLMQQDIASYSLDLARGWGLGDAELNNGLLLLVAPNERQMRIEVGRGLEASVKDEEAAQIIREHIVPEFRESNYEAGIDAGVDQLVREVTPIEMKEAA